MKNSNVIGIDLAKNVMQICIIDKHGELLSNKAISPSKLKILLANQTRSTVAMEACGACHRAGSRVGPTNHLITNIFTSN
jgi:transposase